MLIILAAMLMLTLSKQIMVMPLHIGPIVNSKLKRFGSQIQQIIDFFYEINGTLIPESILCYRNQLRNITTESVIQKSIPATERCCL